MISLHAHPGYPFCLSTENEAFLYRYRKAQKCVTLLFCFSPHKETYSVPSVLLGSHRSYISSDFKGQKFRIPETFLTGLSRSVSTALLTHTFGSADLHLVLLQPHSLLSLHTKLTPAFPSFQLNCWIEQPVYTHNSMVHRIYHLM